MTRIFSICILFNNSCSDGTCHFWEMYKHPVQIIFVRVKLITSGGVLKHPIYVIFV